MNNELIMPSILGTGKEEKLEKELARRILPKYLALRLTERTNSGNRVALMVSPTDGYGRYNFTDHVGNLEAGEQYKLMFGRNAKLFDYASSQDLREVIQDEDFAHIFVIGHANHHSWRASDKSVDWFDLGQMVNGHLKNGIFANVGCGGINSWNMIPLGYFVVANHSTLLGYEAEYADGDKLGDLSRLKSLRKRPALISLI